MKKNRKTRSEKISADMRIKNISPDTRTSHVSVPSSTNLSISQSALPANQYTFVRSDLQKTIIITSAIVIAELVLFFVMKP